MLYAWQCWATSAAPPALQTAGLRTWLRRGTMTPPPGRRLQRIAFWLLLAALACITLTANAQSPTAKPSLIPTKCTCQRGRGFVAGPIMLSLSCPCLCAAPTKGPTTAPTRRPTRGPTPQYKEEWGWQASFVLFLTIASFLAMALEIYPAEWAMYFALCAAWAANIVTTKQALAGFSNSGQPAV
jgi:hypothetical protein